MGIKATKPMGIRPSRAYRNGDYGNSRRHDQDRSLAIAQRKLSPLPEPVPDCSIRSTGCTLVARLIQRKWDCHTSMPRHHIYLFRVPKFGGRDAMLTFRDGKWKLIRSKRKKNDFIYQS
ncbi:MAG: hypothetical protein SVX43_18210 [Cyanobacteriota bacterium]|nr:hypothetical protein [Cyanobacteriota bacterium]